MKFKNNAWNTDAERAMMGFIIPVESTEHLTYMVDYCLKTLKSDVYRDDDSRSARATEIVRDAENKYNSSKDKSIKWFVVNDSVYGVMMTFVRDKGSLTTSTGRMKANGILAWVENIDHPMCSELGYVYFRVDNNGKTVRCG